MEDTTCELCNLLLNPESIAGGIIKVTEYFIVVHHQPPVDVKGWLIIVPRRHVEFQTELSRDELGELIKLQAKFTADLKNLVSPERIYWVCFSETVRHIHFHLIPRDKNLPEERRGPKIFSGEKAGSLAKEQIDDICAKIRANTY